MFHLPLRQTEGFLRSLFALMDVDLDVPDHTTLSRRSTKLQPLLTARISEEPIVLIIDSTGLSVVGEGEWAAAKHGGKGRRGWKKLHLGVDATGEIVAQVLTGSSVHDGSIGAEIIKGTNASIETVIGDAAYDSRSVYEAAESVGAGLVVPPNRAATVGKPKRRRKCGKTCRAATIDRIRQVGRRQWMAEFGYHRQGRVKNTFFRYKSELGGRLRARTRKAQEVEATLACKVLNQMRALGWPQSVKAAN